MNCKSVLKISFWIIIFSFGIRAYAQRQTENSFRSKFGPDYLVGFLTYLPVDYAVSTTKKFPLLLFLHGGGEKTYNPQDLSQLYLVKKNGPPKLIEAGMDFPFIVVSPQCPFGDWDMIITGNNPNPQSKPGEFVDEILEKMKTLYRVDLNRIYITGLSIGGAATWEYTQRHPEKIAASIPIAGWGDGVKSCDIASNNVAVWAFQGELDGKDNILSLKDQINNCAPATKIPAKATIYQGVGHDAWTETYNNTGPGIAPDNIYDWLLRQSKYSILTENENDKVIEEVFQFDLQSDQKIETANLILDMPYQDEIYIKVYDESFKEILNQVLSMKKGQNRLIFDLSRFKNGIYFFNVQGCKLSKTKKLMIAK